MTKENAEIAANQNHSITNSLVTIHHPATTKEPKLLNKRYYDRTRSKRYLPSG